MTLTKEQKQRRREIRIFIEKYFKELMVGVRKFENGSNVEIDYVGEKFEHMSRYIQELKQRSFGGYY